MSFGSTYVHEVDGKLQGGWTIEFDSCAFLTVVANGCNTGSLKQEPSLRVIHYYYYTDINQYLCL